MRWLTLLVGAVLAVPGQAFASFHFMQIEQVIGGVQGDTTAQAIQLRMRSNGQDQVQLGKLVAWDANGENPVVLLDIASAVAVNTGGSRILIASANFANNTEPPAEADFILDQLIPESYLAAGSLTFENDDGTLIVFRLSWGGAEYKGSTEAALTNDDGDGEFGPPVAFPLPSDGVDAVLFQGAFGDSSSTNTDDFALTPAAATFTNNAGASFLVTGDGVATPPPEDADDDGVFDDQDNCSAISNADQSDRDGDGSGDDCDGCPDDADKTDAGACGCGTPDDDADNDGVPECLQDDSDDDVVDDDDADDDVDDPDDGSTDDDADTDDADDDDDSTVDDADDAMDDDATDDDADDDVTTQQDGPPITVMCGPGTASAMIVMSMAMVGSRLLSLRRRFGGRRHGG